MLTKVGIADIDYADWEGIYASVRRFAAARSIDPACTYELHAVHVCASRRRRGVSAWAQ
jgi:hypothetical protein